MESLKKPFFSSLFGSCLPSPPLQCFSTSIHKTAGETIKQKIMFCFPFYHIPYLTQEIRKQLNASVSTVHPPCSNSSSHFVCLKLCFFKSLPLCLNICMYLQTFLCPCSFIQGILQNVFSFLTGFNHFCNKHVLQHNSQP